MTNEYFPDCTRFYIDGQWSPAEGASRSDIINPATEESIGQVALGEQADVDLAVASARKAFSSYSSWSVKDRLELLQVIDARLEEHNDELATIITKEMGAPTGLSRDEQAPSGSYHFKATIKALADFSFEEPCGTTMLRHEPIGVCALITPWNWPVNQIATKVAPALAAGCTMILKPSELAPGNAALIAKILHESGVPAGVFNLVHGDGPGVGSALSAHGDVDMVSFTGSTRAGIQVSRQAADTIKRVSLELGGKSAAIIVDDADLNRAIRRCVQGVMINSGQSCNATSRLLVPRLLVNDVAKLAVATAEAMAPAVAESKPAIGPIANKTQYERVIGLIDTAIREGATLVTGGVDKPDGLDRGYYVKPTIFRDVTPDMTIAREEIFGPVVTIMAYDHIDEAVEIANDTAYGLSGAVWSADRNRAYEIATRLRTGMVHLNGASLDSQAPFGGYKMSGNGREWGRYGLEEFLEVKSIYGACA